MLLGAVMVAAVAWDVVVRRLSCASPLPWAGLQQAKDTVKPLI